MPSLLASNALVVLQLALVHVQAIAKSLTYLPLLARAR